MADAKQYRKVRDILLSDPSRRVVVVSAAGTGVLEMVSSRYIAIRDELGIDLPLEEEFAALKQRLDARSVTQDELVSRGEYFSAKLMAAYLDFQFIDAVDWVKFTLDGEVDKARSYSALRAMVSGRGVVTPV